MLKMKIDDLILNELNELSIRRKQELLKYIKGLKAKKTEKTIEILSKTAGSWCKLIDAEKLKRNIYADRLISTRPKVTF